MLSEVVVVAEVVAEVVVVEVDRSHFSAVEAVDRPCVDAGTKMMVVDAYEEEEDDWVVLLLLLVSSSITVCCPDS